MLKILLIEDELIIAKDLKMTLEKNEFSNVQIAKNETEAFQLFKDYNYDLIITDINLNSAKDGIEIISYFNTLEKVPVVYLTAYSDNDIIKRAEATSPFAYLLKPFNESQLKATINLALINFKKRPLDSREFIYNSEQIMKLTKREKQVLVTLSSGNSTKEIAEVLSISNQTVEKHKQNIREKLNLRTVAEMINFTMTSRLYKLK
jgi:DNA-binding NarL/FixJ family response regulator